EVLPQEVEEQSGSVQEFYSYMQEAIDDCDWWSAIDYAEIVLYHFPESPYGQEIPYLIGTAYYQLKQYELANTALTEYLNKSTSPKHFEEAIEMKFAIAEFFREGGKKRLFGSHKLPAWLPAQEDALKIYDEVITTLPHHEIAIRALLGKAEIQAYLEDFKPSVETLQLLIRRFPKHDLTVQGYLDIGKVYLQECQAEHLDPSLLDLAEMNLQKFNMAFPREPRLAEAQAVICEMKELYAQNLLETGEFFQRRKQKDASAIYFSQVIAKYPGTKAAVAARENLDAQPAG
ncbi:MAG: outer membrane protein assembly factor BamD, partial [Parachlamydia sp.]|nr:outer membrane protein assembly factor BamD [Parachlamydia sp.]